MAVPTYSKPAVRNAWADTAVPTTDIVDPGNAIVTEGWLETSQPPPRQYFNWVLNWSAAAVRYFCQNGISSWDVSETYNFGSVVDYNGWLYQSLVSNNTGNSPITALGATTFWAPLNGYAYVSSDSSVASNIHNLINYVTNSSLASALTSYVTQSSLTSQLANYVTNSSLASTLTSYLTIASAAGTYVSNSSLASTLTSYLTSATAAGIYAPLISPHFSGTPTAPSAANGTVTTQIATTQFAVGTFGITSNLSNMKLPSGIIIQWGTVASTGGAVSVPFSVTFPNNCLSITATSFPVNGTISTSDPFNSNTGFVLTNGAGGAHSSWIAIGY